eukprot:TRINITY_DN13187_c0_g1_i1.p1 TRINITY_DN13187_c0_g1~~TRINITY_DN13187_c0_g1_i1.p1  ORF type:complete len:568 (+),score=229.00 TRINITY_DN13187_c0_g1_i1:98-1801(+)
MAAPPAGVSGAGMAAFVVLPPPAAPVVAPSEPIALAHAAQSRLLRGGRSLSFSSALGQEQATTHGASGLLLCSAGALGAAVAAVPRKTRRSSAKASGLLQSSQVARYATSSASSSTTVPAEQSESASSKKKPGDSPPVVAKEKSSFTTKLVEDVLIGLMEGQDRNAVVKHVLANVSKSEDPTAFEARMQKLAEDFAIETEVEQGEWWEFKGIKKLTSEEILGEVASRIDAGALKLPSEMEAALKKNEAELAAREELKRRLDEETKALKQRLDEEIEVERDLRNKLQQEAKQALLLKVELSQAGERFEKEKAIEAMMMDSKAVKISELEAQVKQAEATMQAQVKQMEGFKQKEIDALLSQLRQAEEMKEREVASMRAQATQLEGVKEREIAGLQGQVKQAEADAVTNRKKYEEDKKRAEKKLENQFQEKVVTLTMTLEQEKLKNTELEERNVAMQKDLELPQNEVRTRLRGAEKDLTRLRTVEDRHEKALARALKAESREKRLTKILEEVTQLTRKVSEKEGLPTKRGGGFFRFLGEHVELREMLEKLAEVHEVEEEEEKETTEQAAE